MTIGHRFNAIYQDVVSAALDLEIDMLARAGERFRDGRLMDRDTKFDAEFRGMMKASGIKSILLPRRAPNANANAIAERSSAASSASVSTA